MNSTNPSLQGMEIDRAWFETDLLDRFQSYARIHTASDPHVPSTPSTDRQFDLARQLESELKEMGVTDVSLDERCYLIARLPGTAGGTPIGLMAHLDTTHDFTGESVRPQVHERYGGGRINLGHNYVLDPAEYPMLCRYKGETIITTDGSTLLGSDDKAGIAEIMTAVRYLIEHPGIPHPPIELIFTPDEETGRGMDGFPQDQLQSRFCFTLDGTDEGSVETECFNAFKATVTFAGYAIHPGSARGKLANATAMAAQFVSLLPRSESPEATDGRYGFYCPTEISGGVSSATVFVIVRDFDMSLAEQRVSYLDTAAHLVEGAFPGGTVSVEVHRQYLNMAEFLGDHPDVVGNAKTAIRQTGMEPLVHQIRGGTDGARLSEHGIPTPNIFTGGQNLHGRFEWIALPAMVRASKTVINLVQLFVDGAQPDYST
ncbi:MAG: peptidase T [Spirochaetia bacterium]